MPLEQLPPSMQADTESVLDSHAQLTIIAVTDESDYRQRYAKL
jgi:hypothetical protein